MATDKDWMWWGESDDEEDLRSVRSGSRSGSGSSSYSFDSALLPWKGEAEVVSTSYGPIHVTVCGERRKPALITYHDVGLNHLTCFQGLFLCADIATLLLHNFCVYHIDSPGHEIDALPIPGSCPELSADDLAEQVAEVAAHYALTSVVGLGVSAGAYILTLFAVNYPHVVAGLILVSPVWRPPSLAEWCRTKLVAALLTLYGTTRYVKELLLRRYFCQEQCGFHGPGSDAVRAFRRELDDRVPANVARYLQAMQSRGDLTEDVARLGCHTLIMTGEKSPFLEESLAMSQALDKRVTSWTEVQACGSLVTEERPHTMQSPLELFLLGLGYLRPPASAPHHPEYRSPFNSPLSPHLTPEALSPQGLGLKLKPIRTRVAAGEGGGNLPPARQVAERMQELRDRMEQAALAATRC